VAVNRDCVSCRTPLVRAEDPARRLVIRRIRKNAYGSSSRTSATYILVTRAQAPATSVDIIEQGLVELVNKDGTTTFASYIELNVTGLARYDRVQPVPPATAEALTRSVDPVVRPKVMYDIES